MISVYCQSLQCGERSNAVFRTQSAAEQTSLAPHDSKARLLSGRDSQGFMAKPCTPHLHCAARAVIQATNCQCRGSRGTPLAFSWGVRGPFSHVREWPPLPRPHTVWGQKQRCRAAPPVPCGRKKKQPSRAAFLPRPRRESCPNCQYGILIPISPLFSLDNMQY